MTLAEYDFPGTCSSEDDNLLEQFYIPALSQSLLYKRAVGYFSASMLCHAAQGLSALYANGGRCQLIIGNPLEDEEYDALRSGYQIRDIYRRFEQSIHANISAADSPLFSDRLALLSTLVARDRITIKLALRHSGMYHDKCGIFEDSAHNKLAFSGSANETSAALLPEHNVESIFVYPSWRHEIYELYGKPIEDRFARLWNGTAMNTFTVDCPSRAYELLSKAGSSRAPSPNREIQLVRTESSTTKADVWPAVPEYLAGHPYALRAHQVDALNAWKSHDYSGIYSHATGSGKTITALHGAARLAQYHRKRNASFVLVVSVPYQVLAEQWQAAMRLFNMHTIAAFGGRRAWYTTLDQAISDMSISAGPQFLAIVVVNATLVTEAFQHNLARVPEAKMLFIGDECHHHGRDRWLPSLPNARYRLGLSATPFTASEPARRSALRSYYGEIVSSYSIDDALADGILCPYGYEPIAVRLSETEAEEYEALTAQIAQALGGQASDIEAGDLPPDAKAAVGRRARLLGSAENKFEFLSRRLRSIPRAPKTLFYCGDGSTEGEGAEDSLRDVERVARILDSHGWKSSRITAEEGRRERSRILENFGADFIDALVAIRVLDEGFDMPSCTTAYLLASSRNQRQYVQRRGRILRPSPSKHRAHIVDFLLLPPDSHRTSAGTNLVRAELTRASVFAGSADNKWSVESTLQSIAAEHGLDYRNITRDVELEGVTIDEC